VLGQSWTTRAMHTLVTVHDQQPIVLGGLMSDRKTTSESGVPILADLPLVGVLFRSTSTEHEKRNLMIVLVPYVVQDAMEARHLRERKLRERQEFETAIGNLDETPFDPHVDYGKKRGLVAEINHQVMVADEDATGTLREAPPAAAPPAATPSAATPVVPQPPPATPDGRTP
jgi:Flp pilus assembly secretin CpaC